jgi:hypothetical protein
VESRFSIVAGWPTASGGGYHDELTRLDQALAAADHLTLRKPRAPGNFTGAERFPPFQRETNKQIPSRKRLSPHMPAFLCHLY